MIDTLYMVLTNNSLFNNGGGSENSIAFPHQIVSATHCHQTLRLCQGVGDESSNQPSKTAFIRDFSRWVVKEKHDEVVAENQH